MKKLTSILLLLASNASFSATKHIDISQSYLFNDPNLRSWAVHEKESSLEKGISKSLQNRIIRKGRAFQIDLRELERSLRKQHFSHQPEISLAIRFFQGGPASIIQISHVSTSHGRSIMRGSVRGKPGAQVRLIEHEGSLTGTIRFPEENKAIVLLSDGAQISAAYEIDVSNLNFD